MGKLNSANLKKAIYYFKRNGLLNTLYAVGERLGSKEKYTYREPSEGELTAQRQRQWEQELLISIVSPAYRTPVNFLKEMIGSVQAQTYPSWELVIADASEDDSVRRIVSAVEDERIRYISLERNEGIADNTNRGILAATGDYIALLDHDDVLTPNALYEMADRIEEAKKSGRQIKLLYSDEDKCNQDKTVYYEPHRKEKFNLDLLLSNNYICHFMVMESKMMKELLLRSEYNGAQDYDLVLRASSGLMNSPGEIVHVDKVLYHWRCHQNSTAENPASKQYAYEAGRRALQSFADDKGWNAKAVHLKHLGFYELRYQPDILSNRTDVGAVGGCIVRGGRISGGAYNSRGGVLWKGISRHASGYMHRAVLTQDAFAVDLRLIQVRKECRTMFEQVTGCPYVTIPDSDTFDGSLLPPQADIDRLSMAFGRALRKAGYRVLWYPSWKKEV